MITMTRDGSLENVVFIAKSTENDGKTKTMTLQCHDVATAKWTPTLIVD